MAATEDATQTAEATAQHPDDDAPAIEQHAHTRKAETGKVCAEQPARDSSGEECGRTVYRDEFAFVGDDPEGPIEQEYCPIHGLSPRAE